MDDGRTTEPAYTISSPGAFGSGELKNAEGKGGGGGLKPKQYARLCQMR